jgi:hypothetical protein
MLPKRVRRDVELYQPLVLPFGLQLGVFLMLALGLSPRRAEPEPKAKRKPRKKAAAKPKAKALGNVSTFKRQPSVQRNELSPAGAIRVGLFFCLAAREAATGDFRERRARIIFYRLREKLKLNL